MKNKIIAGLFCLMLFSFASAAVITIVFGSGLTYLNETHIGTVGAANPNTYYWVSTTNADNFSTNPAEATASLDFNEVGILQFKANHIIGGCDWFGIIKISTPTISDGKIAVASLDGQGVSDDQFLYLIARPTARGIGSCQLDFDGNVTTA